VVLTVFFALGATRLARSRVLTRHFPAIETLGAATTLCVDKTGTLTENRMTVRHLWRDGSTFEPDADVDGVRALVAAAAAASPAVGADPMDRATRELATRRGAPAPEGAPVREVALSAERPMLTLAWPDGEGLHLGVKGAVETVAAWAIPDAAARAPVLAAADSLATDGLRVLAVASAAVSDSAWDGDLDRLAPRFEGLVAYEDPVRPEVPAAIESCRAAGIRVVVLTGDSAATARAVAHRVGLRGEVLLGAEATHLDDAGLESAVASTAVFARVVPELKLRLVRALQRRGEVVAMTGDGVNDAPALQAAHIGIAMGRRGTDVAREAADLVLIEDDFAAIVDAVRLGRRIHDNLEKAMRFVLAVHVPILAGSLVPPLVGWPTLLSPVHIALLELVIDPACTLAFEAEKGETDVMRRPPRRPDERVFRRELVGGAVAQGLGVAAAVLAAFGGALWAGLAETEARGAALTTLLVALVGLIAVNRSHDDGVLAVMRRPNRAFVGIALATAGVLVVLDGWPAVGALFDLAPLAPGVLAAAVGLGAASVLPAEVAKVARRGRRRSGPP
jgi:Ca2+-transporting ATPase